MRLRTIALIAATAAGLAAADTARAQTGSGYDLSWHALSNGGTVSSTGGAYRVNGLSGQPAVVSSGNAYTLNAGFYGATFQMLAAVPPKPSLPKRFALYAPAPNPSPGAANITFDLPRVASVGLVLYDVNGRVVRRLTEGSRAAGQYHVAWDGRTESGFAAAPGIYLLDFHANGFHATRRIVHL
jgi:hypothetical protein